MTRASLFPPLALAAAMALSACAATPAGDAPSLAKRPVEGRFDVAPPAIEIAPPGPLPSDLAGRLARWQADGAQAQQAFAAERGTATALVAAAAGAPVASERWVVAQQSISRLVAARAPLTTALADIDRLYLDRSVEERIDGLPEIYALRDRLADMVSTQDAIVEGLSTALPGG